MATAWAGPTGHGIINEGTGKSETDIDGEYECRSIGGGGGMVMQCTACFPIRTQLKVIRVCLDVLAEQEDGYK